MKKFAFEDPRFLGERMRALRLEHGMKQEDIAVLLSISRSTYSYYETGTTRPDPNALGMLAKIYEVPVSCFFQEEQGTSVKKPKFDPSSLGKLTDDEKSLILFLRANGHITTNEVLAGLEKQVSKMEEEK